MITRIITIAIALSTAQTHAISFGSVILDSFGGYVQLRVVQTATLAGITAGAVYYFATRSNIDKKLTDHELFMQKLFKHYQEILKPEGVSVQDLYKKFTQKDCTHHATPSIADYDRQLQQDREQVARMQEELVKHLAAWKKQGNTARITQAENIMQHAQMFLQSTQAAHQKIHDLVPEIDHAVCYYRTKFKFKDLLSSGSWQLDAQIRSHYRDEQFPYPHIKCVNHATASYDRLQEKEEPLQDAQALKQPSITLRSSLQTLINHVVTTHTYQEQQRARLQHEVMVREVAAKEQRARAEQDRVRVQEQAAQELKRKNDLAQQQLDVTRNEQMRLMAESIAHTQCKQTIAAHENQIRAHEQALAHRQQEMAALRNAYTQQEQDRTRVRQLLAQLQHEVTTPPFNPANDHTIHAWITKMRQYVNSAVQREAGQEGQA